MSQKYLRRYLFTTDAQWNTCLVMGADRDSRQTQNGLRPFAPYAVPATRYETLGGWAPAVSSASEVLWRDKEGSLQRLPYGDDKPHAVTAPFAIANAKRLVATSNTLWAIGETGRSLQGFDLESLARWLTVAIQDAEVLDIAGDSHDGIYALLVHDGAWEIAHYDCTGHPKSRFPLKEISDARAVVYLRRADRLVALSVGPPKLHWYDPNDGSVKFSIHISSIRPCFDVTTLGSDGHARMFVGGSDGMPFGGLHHVLTLDSEGNPLSDVEVDEKATGTAGNRSHLLVTTAKGLLRFGTGKTVPRDSSEIRAALITPVLQSPPTEDFRRWLRVEAKAILPPGSTLEIAYAATDNREVREKAASLAKASALPVTQRMQRLGSHLGQWQQTISFHGTDTVRANESVLLSAPLYDIREEYLWVSINLIASAGGEIPVLLELAVLYPGRTLMENLPAVYQRAEAESGSFLRSLVGVLETTTQTLDARIGDLGRHIHPQTATGTWLDFVARWIGLPWNDALSLDQKQAIAMHAADIAKGRGTRAGLEVLLASLMPEQPRRFRVVDATADFGFVTVGGDACAGSRLPAILAGLPPTATELGSKAILGKARLPCPDSEGDFSRLVGWIRVDVIANADEQKQWQPWLGSLINEMVPVTARVQLRWLSKTAFHQNVKLDDGLSLGLAPIPHLGTDAVTRIARLPGQRGISLSGSGVDSGSSLY